MLLTKDIQQSGHLFLTIYRTCGQNSESVAVLLPGSVSIPCSPTPHPASVTVVSHSTKTGNAVKIISFTAPAQVGSLVWGIHRWSGSSYQNASKHTSSLESLRWKSQLGQTKNWWTNQDLTRSSVGELDIVGLEKALHIYWVDGHGINAQQRLEGPKPPPYLYTVELVYPHRRHKEVQKTVQARGRLEKWHEVWMYFPGVDKFISRE